MSGEDGYSECCNFHTALSFHFLLVKCSSHHNSDFSDFGESRDRSFLYVSLGISQRLLDSGASQ